MGNGADTNKHSTQKYTCAYCGNLVASNEHYYQSVNSFQNPKHIDIGICPHCKMPTILVHENYKEIIEQIPNTKFGKQIKKLPEKISKLYDEIRNAYTANCFNSIALLSRTLLLSVCISLDKTFNNQSKFIECVEGLHKNNYIPKNSSSGVDKLRSIGNKSTHELYDVTQDDAKMIIKYIEMLLTLIYEFKDDETELNLE